MFYKEKFVEKFVLKSTEVNELLNKTDFWRIYPNSARNQVEKLLHNNILYQSVWLYEMQVSVQVESPREVTALYPQIPNIYFFTGICPYTI